MAKSPFLKLLARVARSQRNSDFGRRAPASSPHDPARRDFIKTAAAGFAAATTPWPARWLASSAWAASSTPVCVIGAGYAGLSAAYSLAKKGIPCEVYEATPRSGGRVWTYDKFNAEGMFCELGGEFIDSNHHEILNLARELGLGITDWRPSDKGLKRHQYYIGGRHYYDDELAAAAVPLAKRLNADAEKVLPGSGDTLPTYKKHGPDAVRFDRMSLAEYLDSMKDIEKWVRDAVGVAYLTEYGLDLDEQSAINLLALADSEPGPDFDVFGTSNEAIRITGGNSRLAEALEKYLKARIKIEYNQRLTRITDTGGQFTLTFAGAGPAKEVKARQVICAIPFSTLRQVEGLDALGLSTPKLKMIREVGYGTNAKYCYGFKSRLWRKPNAGQPGSTGYTFDDLLLQTYWDTSREQKGKSGIICHFPGGKAGRTEMPDRVNATLAELDRIHPGIKRLHDGNLMSWTWYNYPFALGSYTCPRPGQWTEFFGAAKEPELGGRLLFAGEHVSDRYQGYMNGAVATGLAAARAAIAAR